MIIKHCENKINGILKRTVHDVNTVISCGHGSSSSNSRIDNFVKTLKSNSAVDVARYLALLCDRYNATSFYGITSSIYIISKFRFCCCERSF